MTTAANILTKMTIKGARQPPSHARALLGGFAAAAVFIAVTAVVFPKNSLMAIRLFDNREGSLIPFPLGIQNWEWVAFFLGLGELWWLNRRADLERHQLKMELLPEAEDVMLDRAALLRHTREIKGSGASYRIQKLLLRVIWQFQSSGSLSQATEVMNTSVELEQHSLDLSYNLIRYATWLLPTLGFVGTSFGLGSTLMDFHSPAPDKAGPTIEHLAQELGVAFNSTLLALVLSAILVLLMQLVQAKDEDALNLSAQYCVDHLINKMFTSHAET